MSNLQPNLEILIEFLKKDFQKLSQNFSLASTLCPTAILELNSS